MSSNSTFSVIFYMSLLTTIRLWRLCLIILIKPRRIISSCCKCSSSIDMPVPFFIIHTLIWSFPICFPVFLPHVVKPFTPFNFRFSCPPLCCAMPPHHVLSYVLVMNSLSVFLYETCSPAIFAYNPNTKIFFVVSTSHLCRLHTLAICFYTLLPFPNSEDFFIQKSFLPLSSH